MILISILFVGVNYVIYTYFIKNELNSVNQARNKYMTQKQKLSDIKAKKQTIDTKKKELEKLKQKTANFDNMVPVKIDTPQLIYDFYNGCKLYGVTGQNISFQLLGNNNSSNNPNVSSNSNGNNNVNSSNNINRQDTQNNQKFYSLTIDLKITGDKGNVESFIKNLGVITKRMLNIKSISISSIEDNISSMGSNNQGNTQNSNNIQNQLSINNANLTETGKKQSNTSQKNNLVNQLSAEIIFYQYIQDDKGSQENIPNNYEFYDSQKEGFSSIADMFK
ncbi:hypothetical protein [Clostridium thailandense]|uniref:hypothetical protein n=1 Tax=Clostridium thailandense TaxID=2794346 RepID=UPI003989AF99